MSFGYSSFDFELIDETVLAKVCPLTFSAYDALRQIIDTSGSHSYNEFVQWVATCGELNHPDTPINSIDAEEFFNHFEVAYKNLQSDVAEKIGINIILGFHDQKHDGSRYDDVDGAYFEAQDVFQLSSGGKLSRELGLSSSAQYVHGG